MPSIGINLDPLNPAGRPDPASLVAQGFSSVRFVIRPQNDVFLYALACEAAGLPMVYCVIKNDSGLIDNLINASWPRPALWEIGNEQDDDGPSSSHMTQTDYIRWANPIHDTLHAAGQTTIVGGLSTGQAQWWADVAPRIRCDGVGVHPYNKDPEEARALIREYKAVTPDLPIHTTEWNRPPDQILTFAQMLAEECASNQFFCYSSGMVEGFGLVDENGAQTAAGAAMAAILTAQPVPAPIPPVPPVEVQPVANYQLGFEKWHDLEPTLIGEAVRNELNVAPEWQTQPTANGILSWIGGKGHAFVTHDGRVYRWREDWDASLQIA